MSELETETLAIGANLLPFQIENFEKNLRILIVDDLGSIRKILNFGLRQMGFTNIVEANEGNEALCLFDQFNGHFDLVITDLNMGRAYSHSSSPMNGDRLILQLMQRKENLPIILCCSPIPNEITDGLVESGRIGFLPKPFYQKDLSLSVITQLMRSPKK